MNVTQTDGVRTVVALQDGALHTGTVQDCTPYLDRAKAMHNEGFHGSSDMKLAASIPFVLVEKYLNDAGILMSEFCNNPQHMRRMLSDPALAHFRIWNGKI